MITVLKTLLVEFVIYAGKKILEELIDTKPSGDERRKNV